MKEELDEGWCCLCSDTRFVFPLIFIFQSSLGEGDIQLAMSETCTFLRKFQPWRRFCPWLLLIVVAYANRIGNWNRLRQKCKLILESIRLIFGINTRLPSDWPVRSPALRKRLYIHMWWYAHHWPLLVLMLCKSITMAPENIVTRHAWWWCEAV